jgi:hypothetical protein
VEINDKELENLFSDSEVPVEPEEPEVPEIPEEPDVPEEPEPSEVPEEPEPVEALTDREIALMEQFTQDDLVEQDSFDPSVPPKQVWDTQEYNFIKEGESIDDILSDPAKFNAKIAELYNAALQRGAQLALEATYKSLPRTISTYAKQQIDVVNTVNEFYQQNKDLIPLKPALVRIAQKVGTEHPEYTLPQLLNESAKAARTIFKMQKTAPTTSRTRTASPAFVQQKGGANRMTRPKGGKSLEDEVMELIG